MGQRRLERPVESGVDKGSDKMSSCDTKLDETLDLAAHLERVASEGQSLADDTECLALFGLIRECAARIRRQALLERSVHRQRL